MQAQSILRWRFLIGPLVTIAAGIGLVVIDRDFHEVPAPGSLMFFFVLFSAYVGGVVPGLISAALCVAFSAVLLSEPEYFFVLSPASLQRWIALALVAPCTALAVGLSQTRARRERERIVEANRELETVRAALDQVDSAVMLLDRDFRVQYMNHAAISNGGFRQRAPGEKPPSAELLREFATNGVYPMPAHKVERFVAGSLAIVQAGNSAPIDLSLADGKVFRFKCNTLPSGGRMLIYSDVSDFVRHADKMQLLAITDAMTGLYNHRHFMKLAKSEWDRFVRHGRSLSVLMVDIDHFKSFNDRFGHEVGDLVLYHVASMLRNNRRSNDSVGRVGGEEFAILMPETDIDGSVKVAERLRQTIDENPFHYEGKDLHVTVSVGIAEAKQGMIDFSDLLNRADQALYEAKRAGRNRVVRENHPLAAVAEAVAPL